MLQRKQQEEHKICNTEKTPNIFTSKIILDLMMNGEGWWGWNMAKYPHHVQHRSYWKSEHTFNLFSSVSKSNSVFKSFFSFPPYEVLQGIRVNDTFLLRGTNKTVFFQVHTKNGDRGVLTGKTCQRHMVRHTIPHICVFIKYWSNPCECQTLIHCITNIKRII